ncbi:unnamed protein product, partial [Phaeothamnion confervicola]
GPSVQLIYDAYNREGAGSTATQFELVEVVFTAQDVTADQHIERETAQLRKDGCPSVMVSHIFPRQPRIICTHCRRWLTMWLPCSAFVAG